MTKLLAAIRKEEPRKLCVLGTPPPKKDSEALRRKLEREPFFLDWAAAIGQDVATIKITEPLVRLKLWHLLQDMFRAEAQKVGAVFVPVPAETLDDEGYLKPEYSADDVTHANEAYGALMLKKAIEELRR